MTKVDYQDPTPGQAIKIGGITINFTEHIANSSKPTLVLIHGFGASLQTWNDLYPLLCKNYSTIRFDLKGAGFSDKPRDGDYSPFDQAILVLAFLSELKQKEVVLVGHSLGGGIALLAYLKSLEKECNVNVRGLILLDSAGYPQSLPFFVEAERNPVTRILSELINPEKRVEYVLKKIFYNKAKLCPQLIHNYAFFLDKPGTSHALRETAKQIAPTNLVQLNAEFGKIKVPTLILWGACDPVISMANAHRFRNDITHSKVVIINEAGHHPHEESAEEICEHIETFMHSV